MNTRFFPAMLALLAALTVIAPVARAQWVDVDFLAQTNGPVYAVAVQADGKILVGGSFTWPRSMLERVLPDGTLDTTFNPNVNGAVSAIVLQPDGKILVAGSFTGLGGIQSGSGWPVGNYLARLNPDGTYDPSFASRADSVEARWSALALQPDGRIVYIMNDADGNLVGVGRFKADGGDDPGFSPTWTQYSAPWNIGGIKHIYAVAVQPDGKVLLAGQDFIARVKSDGTPDPTFGTNHCDAYNACANFTTATGNVYAIAVQPDGNILVAGDFSKLADSAAHLAIGRLTPNGSLDTGFAATFAWGAAVSSIALHADGESLFGGLNLLPHYYASVYRVNADGTLGDCEETILAGTPPAPGQVHALATDVNWGMGKTLAGGNFYQVWHQNAQTFYDRKYLARLTYPGDKMPAATQQLSGFDPNTGIFNWTYAGSFPEPVWAVLQFSADGSNWVTVAPATRIPAEALPAGANGGWTGTVPQTHVKGYFRALGHYPSGRYDGSGSMIASPSTAEVDYAYDTTINITIPNLTVNVGQTVTWTATVTSSSPGIPTGTVAFLDGATPVAGCAALPLENGRATCTTSFSNVGTAHWISAAYSGAAEFHPSRTSASYQVTVSGWPTTTTLASSKNPAMVGDSITFTATVRFGQAQPVTTGTVSFYADTTLLGSNPLDAAGTATLQFSPATSGAYGVYAQYTGALGYEVSVSGAVDEQVMMLPPQIGSFRPAITPVMPSGNVRALAVQPDGKILVGGNFTGLGGSCSYGGRLSQDGTTLDVCFAADQPVQTLAVQPDGKILVGGNFQLSRDGTNVDYAYLCRLNADGSLDTSFKQGADVRNFFFSSSYRYLDSGVRAVVVRPIPTPDNPARLAIVMGSEHGVARLEANSDPVWFFDRGTVNPFVSPIDELTIQALAVEANGNVLAGGAGLFRLKAGDGTPLALPVGLENTVYSLALQADGKILVGGHFSYVARLNSNGSFDYKIPVSGPDTFALAIEPDGDVLAGGNFTSLSDQPRTYIGRITHETAGAQQLALDLASGSLTWTYNQSSPEPMWAAVQFSTDGAAWSAPSTLRRSTGGWTVTLDQPHVTGTFKAVGYYGNHGSVITSILSIDQAHQTVTGVGIAPSDPHAGQTVILTATVSPVPSGSGTPTGSVAFSDGGTTIAGCAAQPLSSGYAACTTSFSTSGVHTITARYGGDAGFKGSTSSSFQVTVSSSVVATISLGAPNVVYGADAPVTVTVAAVSGSAAPTGSVSFTIDGGGSVSQALTVGSGVSSTATFNLTRPFAGSHPLSATYAPSGDFTASGPAAGSLTVSPATLTVSIVGNPGKAYDGTANATLTSANYLPAGLVGSESISVMQTSGRYNSPNVAAATVTASLTASNFMAAPGTLLSNYTLPATASGPGSIAAAQVTATAGGYSGQYDGTAHGTSPACVLAGTYTGDLTCTNSPATVTDAGSGDVTPQVASPGNNLGNFAVTAVNGSWHVTRAPSTLTVTCSPGPFSYTGAAQTPCTAKASGAGIADVSLTVSYSGNVNACPATASANWSGDANHTGSSGSVNFTIAAAPVTATAGSYSGQYDGTAHGTSPAYVLAGTYTGDLTCTNSPATVTDAGSGEVMPMVASPGNNLGNFVITPVKGSWNVTQAPSTVTVTCGPGPFSYTGAAQTPCTAKVSGAGLADVPLTVNYSGNVNAGPATASATWSGDANHTGNTASANFTIAPAQVMATAGSYSGQYDGTAHSTSPACVLAGTYTGDLTCTNSPATVTDAGSGDVTPQVASPGNNLGNFAVTAVKGSWHVTRAPSTVTVTCGPGPFYYTGAAQTPCTAKATGLGLTDVPLTVNYSGNVNAGPATASATWSGDANHTGGSGSANFTIGQASSTVAITGGTFTYDGSAHPAPVSVTGGGGLSLTPSPNYSGTCSSAPITVLQGTSCTASYTYAGDSNHTGSSASATITIALRPITVQPAGQTIYWGNSPSPFSYGVISGSLVGADSLGAPSYTFSGSSTVPTAVGAYTLAVTNLANLNYAISTQTSTFTIAPRPTIIKYTGPASATYGDCETVFTALLTDYTGVAIGGQSVTITVGAQSATAVADPSGTARFSILLNQGASTLSANATYVGVLPFAGSATGNSNNFTIGQSSYLGPLSNQTTYTGSPVFWTGGPGSSSATLTLSATIQDLGKTVGAQVCHGDIRNARITFAARNSTGDWTPIPSAQNLRVGLVDPSNPLVGTATATTQYSLHSGSAFDSFELAIIVSGDYRYNDPVDDTIVSVIIPGPANTINAAGALNPYTVTSGATTYPAASGILATAAGLVPGPEGYLNISGTVTYSKTNKNSTTLTNPQGKILLKFASYNNQNGGVDPAKHSYQIQSNAIASLTQLSNGRYQFTAKANILDLTTGLTVDGGATLQFTVDNAGLASVSLIGKSGTTWLSSAWNGTTTVLKPIIPGGSITGQ